MPELIEQMYCSQQIVIPPKYPYILKRYCKAAIKTQPYDLLRWSFEYFKALAEHRPPPVKLRLEYPIYSTEGGLTRGCLKVLAHQLYGMKEIPLTVLRQAWQGFCLDPMELMRILCLCEVYLREEQVSFFNFLAVAGGMLTKCLTHTMILLCESLTKEPDGGSAAIPVQEFLSMYRFLAVMDASTNVQYLDGYREGFGPPPEPEAEEEASEESDLGESDDDYWDGGDDLQRLSVIDDRVDRTAKLSARVTLPPIGKIERSPSIERITEIERENYYRERIGKPEQSEEVNKKLRAMSSMLLAGAHEKDGEGQPPEPKKTKEDAQNEEEGGYRQVEEEVKEEEEQGETSSALAERIQAYVEEAFQAREDRLLDLIQTFEEIAVIVDKFNTVKYDLGMVAGRQMSTTSGEFIVQSIEKEIMAYINEQIAILPDPDLKKKKAKPEEVAMIREILEQFLDDNMDIIIPEIEEEEEEEEPLPEIVMVYAVPGIGGPVDADIIDDFKEYIKEVCHVQAEMVMPRNIRHFLCPPLEKYIDPDYETIDVPTKEQVPTGGAINE